MYVPPFCHVYAPVVKPTNLSVNRNSSSWSQRANTSAKQSPAAAEGWGSLGWLSSWLPTPVQATKKPMPNPSKGVESLPNKSQTRQTQVLNSSTCNFFLCCLFLATDAKFISKRCCEQRRESSTQEQLSSRKRQGCFSLRWLAVFVYLCLSLQYIHSIG